MHNDDSTQLMRTTVLGRYHLLKRVGKGGMGEVWLAEDPRLHRQVAIKVLPPHAQSDSQYLQRFEREARTAAALHHPHILPVHDYGRQTQPDGQTVVFIVMPYVSGGTLSDRIKQLALEHMLMPTQEVMSYLIPTADAIDYAHEQQVLHRDIKPSNILLRHDHWLLLADFGIARIVSDEEQLTQTGTGVGTPEYMAPEQAQGKPEAASDNYSLAVIAYQLFTGRLPFSAETPYATTIQHIITPPPAPRQINPNISPAVEQVLLHGLAKAPDQRPPSAQDFVKELQDALNGTAPFVSTPPSSQAEEATLLLNKSPQLMDEVQPITPSPTPYNPDGGKLQPAPAPVGVTRRQVLIGGGAALLAVGGIATWATLAATRHPVTLSKPSRAVDPNAPTMMLRAHTDDIASLAWSPTNPTILASSSKDIQVMLWDIQAIQQKQASTTQPMAKQLFHSVPTSPPLVGWSPDGKNLAIGNANKQIDPQHPDVVDTITDVYVGDLSRQIPQYDKQLMTYNRTATIHALSWAPSRFLITTSLPYELANSDQGYYQLEFRDPLKPQVGLASLRQKYFAYALATAPDGVTVAVGTGIGVVVGHIEGSGRTGKWVQYPTRLTFNNKVLITGAVSWSRSGQYLAAINNAKFVNTSLVPTSQIAVCDWQSSEKASFSLSLPSQSTVLTALSWSPAPSSTTLAAGSKDGSVYFWNVNPGNTAGNTFPIRTLKGLSAEVTSLAWSNDGRWLAAGYNDDQHSILIWKI